MADLDLALLTDLPADTGWIDLPLNEGVTGTAAYRKVGDRVTLRGEITGYAAAVSPFPAVPVGFRPKANLAFAVMLSSTQVTRLWVRTSGAVQLAATIGGTAIFEETWVTT